VSICSDDVRVQRCSCTRAGGLQPHTERDRLVLATERVDLRLIHANSKQVVASTSPDRSSAREVEAESWLCQSGEMLCSVFHSLKRARHLPSVYRLVGCPGSSQQGKILQPDRLDPAERWDQLQLQLQLHVAPLVEALHICSHWGRW